MFESIGLEHTFRECPHIRCVSVGRFSPQWGQEPHRARPIGLATAVRLADEPWFNHALVDRRRERSKLRGERSMEDVQKDFARLRRAYDMAWNRGT